MLLHQVVHADAPAPRRLSRRVPHDLDTICLKCLEKDPQRRYASAADLAHDLQCFLDGKPIAARPISTAARLWRWSKRNQVIALLLASVGALLLLLAIGGPIVAAREARARKQADEALALADVEAERNRIVLDAVEEHFTRAVTLLEQLVSEVPEDSVRVAELSDAYSRLAWFLVTAPDNELHAPDSALVLSLLATSRTPDDVASQRALGVARYRLGRWQACVDTLLRVDELTSGGGGPEWAFLAMAYHELGETDEAQRWLIRYDQWLAEQDEDREELERFRDECTTVLGSADTTVP